MKRNIFITGGTGYIGTRLIKRLSQDDSLHIRALVRKGSEKKLPGNFDVVIGDALDAESYKNKIDAGSVFIHLIGVSHPSPKKKKEFKEIDLVSIREAVKAAVHAKAEHFIYLSVAQIPTKIMMDYQQVRAEGEKLLLESGMKCSFIRPWYVLGPGHYWPYMIMPFYFIAKLIPGIKEKAKALDLVTIGQMINTLVYAVNNPPATKAIYDVKDIKRYS